MYLKFHVVQHFGFFILENSVLLSTKFLTPGAALDDFSPIEQHYVNVSLRVPCGKKINAARRLW